MHAAVVIYTKDNCPHCVRAKQLMASVGRTYTEKKIGRDVTREDVLALFPDAKVVPIITVNGIRVGGVEELKQLIEQDQLDKI